MLGVAVASSIHFAIRFMVFVIYIKTSPKLSAGLVPLWNIECRTNLWGQFKLSCVCANLGLWSWWAFDIFTLIASYMSIDDLSA